MIELGSIQSREWGISLSEQNEVVQGINDIHQCILIILSTQRGSDPLRPLFGADLTPFHDLPMTQAIPGIINEIITAIGNWEPRVKISKITYKVNYSQVTFSIDWTVNTGDGLPEHTYGSLAAKLATNTASNGVNEFTTEFNFEFTT